MLGPESPEKYPHPRQDDPAPRELMCDGEAPTLLEAVARAARDIRLMPGLRAVGVRHDDTVTLGEAAQRCSRSRQSPVRLARGQRGSGGFPAPEVETGGTAFCSWSKVAAYLRGIGDDIGPVDRGVVLADHVLRVVEEAEQAGVPPPVPRSLGLTAA
ncbi:hypothetical protein [Streptomyces sp. enrichment culture]|uniref:hypothetical protein n=1 Tax=Streptomyces sp. enrichment culture TaxID=1795815 RepID=UPI003F55873B